MELINLIAIVLSLSAAFSYMNFRFIGLPTTIGRVAKRFSEP